MAKVDTKVRMLTTILTRKAPIRNGVFMLAVCLKVGFCAWYTMTTMWLDLHDSDIIWRVGEIGHRSK